MKKRVIRKSRTYRIKKRRVKVSKSGTSYTDPPNVRLDPVEPEPKRRRLGATAHVLRFLDHWHTMASKARKRRGEWTGMLEFVKAHQQPFKERGDLYFNVLGQIGCLDEGWGKYPVQDLPGLIDKELGHLRELTSGRLNYDDMRAALEKLHLNWRSRASWLVLGKRYIFEASGASKALIGAPVSDAGEMRRALQEADNLLSEAVKSMNENTPREAVLAIWAVIHSARKALKATSVVDGGQL